MLLSLKSDVAAAVDFDVGSAAPAPAHAAMASADMIARGLGGHADSATEAFAVFF